MPPPFTSYTPAAGWEKAADHPISWCPNCHDEAPFLEELYQKYHGLGLEVVALDFEPAEQIKSLSRARAFIKRYGIEYTYLIAGEPRFHRPKT